MSLKLKIWDGVENIESQGFTFQPGFVAQVEGDDILAVTSGWEHDGMLFVYRPTPNGEWVGRWEDETTFPVQETLDGITAWRDQTELSKALQYAQGKKLHISDADIIFIDVVAGEKCYNGGEYGFYTRYSPIPGYSGIYRVSTETTCDFDRCGTGYQGIRALTVREYQRLKKASDRVEAEGSLY